MTVTRPIIRYYGGKWRMAPWIIRHFPEHEIYVEPFAGAGSVLLRKPRARCEVLNDKNGRVVGLFRALRDPEAAAELEWLLRMTPYARSEYEACRKPADDPIEDARRLLVLGHQGHGATAAVGEKYSGWRRGLRLDRTRGTTSASEWAALPAHVASWCHRLSGVFVDCDAADMVIARYDRPQTLFYVDPPYVMETRSRRRPVYAYEMNDWDHRQLAAQLHSVAGMVVLSGYPSALYDELYADWRRVERGAIKDRGQKATEILWINAAAYRSAQQSRRSHDVRSRRCKEEQRRSEG